MYFKKSLLILCLCVFYLPATAQDSIPELADSIFFSDLEKEILKEYQFCKGDSTIPSRKALIRWKSDINFLTESNNYSELLRNYVKETSMDPTLVRPCEILNWVNLQKSNSNETDKLLIQSRKSILSKRDDSLFIVDEFKRNPLKPYHFDGIPLGVTKRGLMLLSEAKNIRLTEKGDHFIADSIKIGSQFVTCAFYFDKNGLFHKYELESSTGSLDSLDSFIRPLADSLGAFMQNKIGNPDHCYRIGRFDITKNKLSVYKSWNFQDAMVYLGLAVYDYRYYAKLIVNADLISQETGQNTDQNVKKD